MYKPFKPCLLFLLIIWGAGCSLVCPEGNTRKVDNVSTYYGYPNSTNSISSYSGFNHNPQGNGSGSTPRKLAAPPTPEPERQQLSGEAQQKQMIYTVEANKAKVQYEVAKNQQEQKKREYEQQQEQQKQQFQLQQMQQAIQNPGFRFPGR